MSGVGIVPLLRAFQSRLRAVASTLRETRLRRAAEQGRPIFVGTLERPYEPVVWRRSPWEVLKRFDGLAVRVTVRPPEIVGQLPALAELDRSHAIAVDLVIADAGREALRAERAVKRLAEQGITARVLLLDRRGADTDGVGLRRLAETVRRAGAFDLRLAGRAPRARARRVRRLRLEHGFPLAQPGRG